jgi:hypothetical protein
MSTFPNLLFVTTEYNYGAYTEKVERNCHFPAPGWNCMTYRQVLQGFPDIIQASLHKKTIKLVHFFL